jgi:hypothetical protein
VWVRFGSYDTDTDESCWRDDYVGKNGIAGFYGGPVQRFEDGSTGDGPNRYEIAIAGQGDELGSDSTLAHEFGHKWYDRHLDDAGKKAWVDSDYRKQWAQDINWIPEAQDAGYYNELYAGNAQHGPSQMTPEERETYYPGLYRDNIRHIRTAGMQPNSGYALPGEEAPALARGFNPSDSRTPYSTEYWVPEHGANRGYFEDGGRVIPFDELTNFSSLRDAEAEYANALYAERNRVNSFSPEYWVNEREAPLGYFEDGGAIRSRLPYPAQWTPPQWPSLDMYDAATGYGMRLGG